MTSIQTIGGGGTVTLSMSDSKTLLVQATEPKKVKLEGKKLTIEGRGSQGGGGIVFNGRGGVSVSGMSFSGGSTSISCINGEMFINGKRVVPGASQKSEEPEEDKNFKKEWQLHFESVLSSVSVSDACSVNVDPFILSSLARLTIQGSGDILITDHDVPVTLGQIHASINGSGDISLGGTVIESLVASINGSGDIRDFTASQQAELSVCGSGDIHGQAYASCEVSKEKMGSGSIRLTKVRDPPKEKAKDKKEPSAASEPHYIAIVNPSGITKDVATEVEDEQCRACMENERRVASTSCGHRILCLGCTKKFTGTTCLLCDKPILSWLVVV